MECSTVRRSSLKDKVLLVFQTVKRSSLLRIKIKKFSNTRRRNLFATYEVEIQNFFSQKFRKIKAALSSGKCQGLFKKFLTKAFAEALFNVKNNLKVKIRFAIPRIFLTLKDASSQVFCQKFCEQTPVFPGLQSCHYFFPMIVILSKEVFKMIYFAHFVIYCLL
jgi:hypothetical protein